MDGRLCLSKARGKKIRSIEGGAKIKKGTHQAIDARILHEHLVEAAYGGEEDDRVHIIKERHPGGCSDLPFIKQAPARMHQSMDVPRYLCK